jgi:NADH-quinone oxidoreductase subunit J
VAETLFYVLGALALACAAGVVLAKSPMSSVLSLLGSFFALSVIYLLAGFQFLAAAQILVYAGAILVLFLFVIMLLNLGDARSTNEARAAMLRRPFTHVAIALSLGLALIGLVAATGSPGAREEPASAAIPEHGLDPLPAIAGELFGRYALPFEAISVLLLATMVAVIVLAKRERRGDGERGTGGAGPVPGREDELG